MPQGAKKAAGIKANLFWDNPQYVLGVSKGGSQKVRDLQRAEDSRSAFIKRIEEIFGQESDIEALKAMQHFLAGNDFSQVFAHVLWNEISESNANLTFILEGENKLIVQDAEIVRQIIDHSKPSGKVQTCAVSGIEDAPAILHTAIKGVWGAQTSGADIVSFNNESFCSFKNGRNRD